MCSVFKSAELSNYLLQNQEFTANSYEKTHGSNKVWLSRRLRGDAMETIHRSVNCAECLWLIMNVHTITVRGIPSIHAVVQSRL